MQLRVQVRVIPLFARSALVACVGPSHRNSHDLIVTDQGRAREIWYQYVASAKTLQNLMVLGSCFHSAKTNFLVTSLPNRQESPPGPADELPMRLIRFATSFNLFDLPCSSNCIFDLLRLLSQVVQLSASLIRFASLSVLNPVFRTQEF